MPSPPKRKASKMSDKAPPPATQPVEGGPTTRARRNMHLPLNFPPAHKPFDRRHQETFSMDRDTSPSRVKQVERDFAMVLAAMPHARTGIPTNTDDITNASLSKKPADGSTKTTAGATTPNGKRDSASGIGSNGDSNSKFSTPGKKRPYRRTKRPKDYCG